MAESAVEALRVPKSDPRSREGPPQSPGPGFPPHPPAPFPGAHLSPARQVTHPALPGPTREPPNPRLLTPLPSQERRPCFQVRGGFRPGRSLPLQGGAPSSQESTSQSRWATYRRGFDCAQARRSSEPRQQESLQPV